MDIPQVQSPQIKTRRLKQIALADRKRLRYVTLHVSLPAAQIILLVMLPLMDLLLLHLVVEMMGRVTE